MAPVPVIIDCSRTAEEVSPLVEWVRSCPRQGAIHVYLRTDRTKPTSIVARSSLQALGCMVTTVVR